MATLRELKGRIGSVASSEKITGAMKMISSAKMHKAEQALKRLVPFRDMICGIIGNLLGSDQEFHSPLLEEREVRNVAVVVFGSDDGLCGAYNMNIAKALARAVADLRNRYGSAAAVRVIPVGQKIHKAVVSMHIPGVEIETVDGVDSRTTGDGVRVFIDSLRERFTAGEIDRVDLVYMNFQSVARQRLKVEQLLPVVSETFSDGNVVASNRPYIFEPDPQRIFQSVLPMFLISVMQEIFTQNRASEQAARVMAMQSANDNAKKLLEELRLEYNKLRQQSITTELLDILGGQVR
ncbi:MAG: ATP synthase F1 subunit gamma [Clostridium sp.]|nr:ATP synthase F1 subunit gamma [Clostridium sp.]